MNVDVIPVQYRLYKVTKLLLSSTDQCTGGILNGLLWRRYIVHQDMELNETIAFYTIDT